MLALGVLFFVAGMFLDPKSAYAERHALKKKPLMRPHDVKKDIALTHHDSHRAHLAKISTPRWD